MDANTIGVVTALVVLAIIMFKVLVWFVPIHYEVYQENIIHEAAFLEAVHGLRPEEIYTQTGELRANIEKKIQSKENEIIEIHQSEDTYIRQYLRDKKLINKFGNIKKINLKRLAYALSDYVRYDRKFVYKSMETDMLTYGITPEDFFKLKKNVQGDVVGVYVIYNMDRRMYYVGQAKRLYFRVWQHFTGHGNGDVYADYKYGNRFIIRFVPLNSSGISDLDELERKLIQQYNAFTTGYNKTIGNGAKVDQSLLQSAF